MHAEQCAPSLPHQRLPICFAGGASCVGQSPHHLLLLSFCFFFCFFFCCSPDRPCPATFQATFDFGISFFGGDLLYFGNFLWGEQFVMSSAFACAFFCFPLPSSVFFCFLLFSLLLSAFAVLSLFLTCVCTICLCVCCLAPFFSSLSQTDWHPVTMQLQIDFPATYPASPPAIHFVTPVFHPNGTSNLSLVCLGSVWSLCMRAHSVLSLVAG